MFNGLGQYPRFDNNCPDSSFGVCIFFCLVVGESIYHAIIDPVFKLHATGDRHPERPARVDAVTMGIEEAELPQLGRIARRTAVDEELLLCQTS